MAKINIDILSKELSIPIVKLTTMLSNSTPEELDALEKLDNLDLNQLRTIYQTSPVGSLIRKRALHRILY